MEPGGTILPESRRRAFDATGSRIISTLDASIDRPLSVDLASDSRNALITIATSVGTLDAKIPRSRLAVSNPHQLLVLMLMASLVLGTLSVLFLRNQVKPIRKLAEAAEAFGKGRSLAFRPTGAEEVRRAGTAFLAMRSRLERQIDQRTQMLSGVSHDLRTPLTRMKLTIALMDPSDESRDLEYDIKQMERMLAEFLAFARADILEEADPTDPFELADRVADSLRRLGRSIVRVDEGPAIGKPAGPPARDVRSTGAAEPRQQRRQTRRHGKTDGRAHSTKGGIQGRGRRAGDRPRKTGRSPPALRRNSTTRGPRTRKETSGWACRSRWTSREAMAACWNSTKAPISAVCGQLSAFRASVPSFGPNRPAMPPIPSRGLLPRREPLDSGLRLDIPSGARRSR